MLDQSLDERIAAHLNSAISSAGDPDAAKVQAPATWSLCATMVERGLAVSQSGGVATHQIGPFRLAVKPDNVRNVNTLLETMIPIAVSYAATGAPQSVAYYIAAVSFAFKVLASTLASGCVIESADEWDIFLYIKHQNGLNPPRYPKVDEIINHFSQRNAKPIAAPAVEAALESLTRKAPIWGSQEVQLVKLQAGGGYVALA